MDTGRVQALIIASNAGNVVYERFYERFGEQDKAELRASLAGAAESALSATVEGTEHASRFRDSAVAIIREGELNYFAVGYGDYDELNLAEILKALVTALRDILRKLPTESLLLDNYGRLCLIVDELIYEGFLDKTEADSIQRGILMKVD